MADFNACADGFIMTVEITASTKAAHNIISFFMKLIIFSFVFIMQALYRELLEISIFINDFENTVFLAL